MNIPSANDDEDFPVFKAGPPLPIRTKTKPNCKIKSAPLKATPPISARSSAKSGTLPVFPTTSISAESKVKQYIEKVKASDELGRKKRIKPEQMLSLEELYQVKVDNAEIKFDPSCSKVKPEKSTQSLKNMQEKLCETLRIVKEKDELINKLRESCHDLAIKCADAENRVDELRFSYGRSSFSVDVEKESTIDLSRKKSVDQQSFPQFSTLQRRCVSAEGLHTCGVGEQDADEKRDEEKRAQQRLDKATETTYEVMKYDAQTQIEITPCGDERCVNARLSEQEVGQWRSEDDILQETCSNWLEKVQNWKTDSNFNLSQDSGGDKDSGFRGSSAEIDAESTLRKRHSSMKAQRKCHLHGDRLLKVPYAPKNNTAQLPQMSSSSTATITVQPTCNHQNQESEAVEEHPTQQHFWPSYSSSQSHLNLSNYHSGTFQSDSIKAKSLFYEMAETSRNQYACFQEACTGKECTVDTRHHRLGGAKSLDVLYLPPAPHHTKEELQRLIDSSFDPPEFILKSHLSSQQRSIDKKVKILGPLLDDTTEIALRVKMKSERLAKMLNDACSLE